MRRALAPLLLLASMTSCAVLGRALAPTHTIDALTAGPLVLDLIEQHDESVARDPVLVPAEKTQALRSSSIVREIIEAAMGEAKQ